MDQVRYLLLVLFHFLPVPTCSVISTEAMCICHPSVRKLCQVNTDLIRTIRVVLADRGYSIAKVAILVGGPGKDSFLLV